MKTVASTRIEMAQVVTPNDANFLGKAFGGAILSMIDLAAYATASKFAETICVTASIDRVDFHSPIEVGDIVTLIGTVTYVGRSSVEVTIDVFAQAISAGSQRHTNTARVTMVALKDGQPTEVPRLVCESREDKIRFLEGKLRRELRAGQQAEFERIAQSFREATDETLDEMLAR